MRVINHKFVFVGRASRSAVDAKSVLFRLRYCGWYYRLSCGVVLIALTGYTVSDGSVDHGPF